LPNLSIYLYNGDWDSTVPFTNTLQNLDRLGLVQNGSLDPLFDVKKEQHVGFSRTFVQGGRKLTFWSIKGAGLRGAEWKGETVYEMFRMMVGR
jgi:hypothetical protein